MASPSHRLTLSVFFVLFAAAFAQAGGDAEFMGKKRTEWIKLFVGAKEVDFRRAGLIALEVYGPTAEGVLSNLMERLKNEADAELRREIAQTLGRMGDDARDAVKPLAQAMRSDPMPKVRTAAARALGGAMAPFAKKIVPELAAALREGKGEETDAEVRTAVAETLRDLGPEAIGALKALVNAAQREKLEESTKVYVIQALGRLGPSEANETAPVLEKLLATRGNATAVRVAAAEALGRLGGEGQRAIGALKAAMADGVKQQDLRRAAIQAFGKVGGPSKETWPDLQDLFTDFDNFIRAQAIRLAGPLGKEIPEVIEELETAALSDQNVEVRIAAVQELGVLGPTAKSAIPTLQSISGQSRSLALREAARSALKRIKSDS